MLSSNRKNAIMNYLLSSLYSTELSKQSIGHILRAIHFSIPFLCIFLILVGNHYLTIISISIVFLSIIAFISFKGCFMTKLESILLEDSFTVVDPMLEFCGFNITYLTRYYITIAMSSLYIIFFCLVLFAKYYTSNRIVWL